MRHCVTAGASSGRIWVERSSARCGRVRICYVRIRARVGRNGGTGDRNAQSEQCEPARKHHRQRVRCDAPRACARRSRQRIRPGLSRNLGPAIGLHVRRVSPVLQRNSEREPDRGMPQARAAAAERRVPRGVWRRLDPGGGQRPPAPSPHRRKSSTSALLGAISGRVATRIAGRPLDTSKLERDASCPRGLDLRVGKIAD